MTEEHCWNPSFIYHELVLRRESRWHDQTWARPQYVLFFYGQNYCKASTLTVRASY